MLVILCNTVLFQQILHTLACLQTTTVHVFVLSDVQHSTDTRLAAEQTSAFQTNQTNQSKYSL